MRAENDTPARAPLDAAALRSRAVRPDGLWREIEVVEGTGSTNADLLARAADGAPEGLVLVADQQADGGTHVASTTQVGRLEVVKIESKGKGFRRLRIRVGD